MIRKEIKDLVYIAGELDRRGLRSEADEIDRLLRIKLGGENATEVVVEAIKRSIDLPHFKNTFKTRNPGSGSEGSVFDEAQTPETLMAAEWQEFNHPKITEGVRGYSANISGRLGMVELKRLDPETPVIMIEEHKGETMDGKPNIMPMINKEDSPEEEIVVDHTVLLIGPNEKDEEAEDIVWTFFPGDPVDPSVIRSGGVEEEASTVKDAIDLGFTHAKIMGE